MVKIARRAAAATLAARRSAGASSGRTSRRAVTPELEQTRQHEVFPWINVPPYQANCYLSAEEVVEQCGGVREDVLYTYIDGELQSERNVLSLPWAMLSVVLYALMMLQHEHLSWHHSVNAALAFHVDDNADWGFTDPGHVGHKNYEELLRPADFYSWMSKGFIPIAGAFEIPVSEDANIPLRHPKERDRTKVANFHRRIGPVKVSQTHARATECVNTDVAAKFGMRCSASKGIDLNLPPTQWDVAQADFDEVVSKTLWLNGNLSDSERKVVEMERSSWIDNMTEHVRVSMLTYNAEGDVLYMTDVNLFFARSGRAWPILTHRAVQMDPYVVQWQYLLDALFYLQVTVLLAHELREVCRHLRHEEGVLKGLWMYVDIWNLVDWAFIAMSYAYLGAWIFRVLRIQDIQSSLLRLPPEAKSCAEDCGRFFAAIFREFEDLGLFLHYLRLVGAWLPLVILLRCLKAFAAQPRLALVTTTLRKASEDIVHYMIVFFAIFASYAVMSVPLFGRELKAFATLDRAFPAIFLMLVGEYNYEELEVAGREFSFVFFFTFLAMLEIVMMSMLIAIIMDVYMDVKASATKSDTLWSEVFHIFRRMWQNRQKSRLPLSKILACLSRESQEVIDMDRILGRVPGLRDKQARRLLVGAARDWGVYHSDGVHPSDVREVVDDVVHTLEPYVPASALESAAMSASAGPSRRTSIASSAAAGPLLDHVPLTYWLDAAALRLSSGQGVPAFPDAAQHLQGLVESARLIADELVSAAPQDHQCSLTAGLRL